MFVGDDLEILLVHVAAHRFGFARESQQLRQRDVECAGCRQPFDFGFG